MVIVDDLVQTGGTLIECAKVGINKLITGGGGVNYWSRQNSAYPSSLF